jgi:hypothetical protein
MQHAEHCGNPVLESGHRSCTAIAFQRWIPGEQVFLDRPMENAVMLFGKQGSREPVRRLAWPWSRKAVEQPDAASDLTRVPCHQSSMEEPEDDALPEEQDDPGFSIHMGITSSFAEGIFYYGRVNGRPLRMLSDDPAGFERKIEMTLAIKGEVPPSEFAEKMEGISLPDGRAVDMWRVSLPDAHADRILGFVEGEILGRIVIDAAKLASDVAEYDRMKRLMEANETRREGAEINRA